MEITTEISMHNTETIIFIINQPLPIIIRDQMKGMAMIEMIIIETIVDSKKDMKKEEATTEDMKIMTEIIEKGTNPLSEIKKLIQMNELFLLTHQLTLLNFNLHHRKIDESASQQALLLQQFH